MRWSLWAASLSRRISAAMWSRTIDTNRPGDEQRGDRGDPAVERVLRRVLEDEGERVGGRHQREVDERGAAGEEVEGEQRRPRRRGAARTPTPCPTRRRRPWRSPCRRRRSGGTPAAGMLSKATRRHGAEERRGRGRHEQHVVVELRLARHEAAEQADERPGAGEQRGGTGHHRPRGGRLDCRPPTRSASAARSRRGGSMLLLWPIASPSKPGATICPVRLSRQNAGGVDPASRSSCARDRAGSTS